MLHIIYVIISLVALVLIIASFFLGVGYRKKIAEGEIGSAEAQAKNILNDAIKSAENKKREILLEAKEDAQNQKAELDKEIKERRAESNKIPGDCHVAALLAMTGSPKARRADFHTQKQPPSPTMYYKMRWKNVTIPSGSGK